MTKVEVAGNGLKRAALVSFAIAALLGAALIGSVVGIVPVSPVLLFIGAAWFLLVGFGLGGVAVGRLERQLGHKV